MANVKLGTKAVGSIVKLKVNGTAKEFIVVHQGKPSSLYDESCNGTWLLMKDIYEKRQWNSYNGNKLESSTIHSYLNSTFLNLFESNIRDAIKQVKIPYRKNGGSGGTDQSGANGLPCKIFLLSGYEVGWTTSDSSFPVDGAKLDYFTGSISGNSKRIANYGGSATYWWLRSPNAVTANSVFVVGDTGRYYDNVASLSNGIRPALVLPPDAEVDSSGNVTPPPPPATHKTLVNGTIYEVTGGKCLINGTVYNILKGRTLINGTGYDIKFSDGLTWVINSTPTANTSTTFNVTFNCAGVNYIRLSIYASFGTVTNIIYSGVVSEIYSYANGGWANQAYRTITFDEPPTGDLLTWLQANAVQQ